MEFDKEFEENLKTCNDLYRQWWENSYQQSDRDILFNYNIKFMTDVLKKWKESCEKVLEEDANKLVKGIENIYAIELKNKPTIENVGVYVSSKHSGYFERTAPIFTEDLIAKNRCYTDKQFLDKIAEKLNGTPNIQIFNGYFPDTWKPTHCLIPDPSSCSIIFNVDRQHIIPYTSFKNSIKLNRTLSWNFIDNINLRMWLRRVI